MVGKFFFHWSSSRGTKLPAVGKQPVQGVQAGIVREYEDGSFRPDAPITRAEMAEMVARALKLPIGEKASTGCADDHAIPQWAKSAVRRFATWAWSAAAATMNLPRMIRHPGLKPSSSCSECRRQGNKHETMTPKGRSESVGSALCPFVHSLQSQATSRGSQPHAFQQNANFNIRLEGFVN